MRAGTLILAALFAILALVLEAAEPFVDVEEARPANADACDAGQASCPMSMIQRMIQPSSVSFSGSAKVAINVHFGSTADLNEEGYKGILGLRSKHELKIFTRRLAQDHDLKIILEERFNDFIAYKVDSNNGMNFNTMLNDLKREATNTCSWLVNTKKVASVDGSSAPLTESGYREVADLRSHQQMNKFIERVINDEGFFLKEVDSLDGMTLYHSCERDSQSLQKVRDELRGVASSPNGWVSIGSPERSSENSGHGHSLAAISTFAKVRSSPSNSGIGITARLNEEGYQSVARTKSNIDMSIFVLRAISQMDFQVVDEDKFNGMIPFYSGDKLTQNFGALQHEIRKVNTEKCAWIGPKDDEQSTNKVDGKTAKVSEEGYVAVARLHSSSDMQDFIMHLLKDMKMEVVDQGGVMGLLPFHDCSKGTKNLKDLRAEISEAAEKNTWVQINSHETTRINSHHEGQGDESADAPKEHDNQDHPHDVDAAEEKEQERKDEESASPRGEAASSSKDHEAAPPSKTTENGGELANKAGTAVAKWDSAHGEDAAGSAKHQRDDKGAEEAAADSSKDAAASSRKDHEAAASSKKDQTAQHSKDADAAASSSNRWPHEETAHNEDVKVASSSNRRRRKGSLLRVDPSGHTDVASPTKQPDDQSRGAPNEKEPSGIDASPKTQKADEKPMMNDENLVQIGERLDSSSGKDAVSTTKQPEGKPTAAPKNHTAHEKPAHKKEPKHKWVSHPNIESMMSDENLVQIGERSSSGKDAVSTTKQPEGKPTAAPKNHTAHEKPAHKKEPKHKWVSHPNIESMKNNE